MKMGRRALMGAFAAGGLLGRAAVVGAGDRPVDLEAALARWHAELTIEAADAAKTAVEAYLRAAWPAALREAGYAGKHDATASFDKVAALAAGSSFRIITPRLVWDAHMGEGLPAALPVAVTVPYATLPAAVFLRGPGGPKSPVEVAVHSIRQLPALLASELVTHRPSAGMICGEPRAAIGSDEFVLTLCAYVNCMRIG